MVSLIHYHFKHIKILWKKLINIFSSSRYVVPPCIYIALTICIEIMRYSYPSLTVDKGFRLINDYNLEFDKLLIIYFIINKIISTHYV